MYLKYFLKILNKKWKCFARTWFPVSFDPKETKKLILDYHPHNKIIRPNRTLFLF
jgi:hypothetical protein